MLGDKIKQNEQGEVVEISCLDAALSSGSTKITDAGLVHLKGLINLQSLYVYKTQITDAGVAELQKALPKCKIRKI